jgi:dipeptidase E
MKMTFPTRHCRFLSKLTGTRFPQSENKRIFTKTIMMNLLLISNSTMAGETYLGWPRPHLSAFFKNHGITRVCFIPYAGIRLSTESIQASYEVYTQMVADVFQDMGVATESVHRSAHPEKMVQQAEAIVVGGGNTFHLVAEMYHTGIMEVIRRKVQQGTPYVGWSAGSNVASPTLMTTNDMPIIEPPSFQTLGVIPFQINPHYLDANPAGHGGETRQQRIEEFLTVNKEAVVAGLREGCLLSLEEGRLQLTGHKSMRLFRYGEEPREVEPGSNLSFLL